MNCFLCEGTGAAEEDCLIVQQDGFKFRLCPCRLRVLAEYKQRLENDPNSFSGRKYKSSGCSDDTALALLIFERRMYRKSA